jgi:hypothetical protein
MKEMIEMKKYIKSELRKNMKRNIKNKERELNRTCRTIWENTNPKGERILYGSFCRNYDRLIVTIGFWKDDMLLSVY